MKRRDSKLENKTKIISLRCTEYQKKKITENAKLLDLSVSEYLIRLALQKKIIANHKEVLSTAHRLSMADNRVENNINQIAHRLNRQANITLDDLGDIIDELRRVAIKRDIMITEFRKIYHLLRNR